MIINQQTLRGIYLGFNTLFNRAFEEEKPLYTEIATVTPRPRTPRPTHGSATSRG